ncbi:BlaI/MecI/CopY family transcriptional regulator [Spirillospora sp. CA-108201]
MGAVDESSDVQAVLDGSPAYTAVMTTLARPARKGLATRWREERGFVYSASVDEAGHTAAAMHELPARRSDRAAVLARFVSELAPRGRGAVAEPAPRRWRRCRRNPRPPLGEAAPGQGEPTNFYSRDHPDRRGRPGVRDHRRLTHPTTVLLILIAYQTRRVCGRDYARRPPASDERIGAALPATVG